VSKTTCLASRPDPALARIVEPKHGHRANTAGLHPFTPTPTRPVPVENAAAYFLALRKAGVPA